MKRKDINNFQISDNFNLQEFQCRGLNCCGNVVKISSKLINICEKLRGSEELIIKSGYRCPIHNFQEGGTPNSYHIQGLAADLQPTKMTLTKLFSLAASNPDIGGCGIYEANFIHIDLRDTDRIFWVKLNGKPYKYFQNLNSTLNYFKEFTK